MAAHCFETKQNEVEHLKQEEDGIVFALNMINSITLPMVVRSAVELGIFDILAKAREGEKLSAEDIATKIGSKNPEAPTMLDRLLRLLTSHSMLYCSLSKNQQGLYSLAPASKCFVTDADGMSFGPLLKLSLDKIFMESWTGLNGAILEGGTPFYSVYGMHIYEYTDVDPRFNDVFNKAMFNYTKVLKSVLEVYKGFEHVKRLVDVGGGLGINLNIITSKYPHIHGVNFDLPHVIENAPTYGGGVTHVGGDMFKCVPKGDAILMKWILHNWDDEHCLKLLKNCHKAIPNDGKVIVVESILPVLPDSTTISKYGFKFDLAMMALQQGGKERTKKEFMELALGSGYSGIKFICCISGFWVMEFFK